MRARAPRTHTAAAPQPRPDEDDQGNPITRTLSTEPAPQNPPQLGLTFETDKLVNEPATATLKIYDADRDEDTPLREITAAASTDAAGQQITWNGVVDGQLVGKGIYVFDLHVSSDANPLILDSDDHKSQTAGIASTSAEEVGWGPSGLGA